MKISIKLSVSIDRKQKTDESVESDPAAAEEQRESSLDALVIPAEQREPDELNAQRRRDSYGYEDKTAAERAITQRQRIGFSTSRDPRAEAALRN